MGKFHEHINSNPEINLIVFFPLSTFFSPLAVLMGKLLVRIAEWSLLVCKP